MKILLVLDAMNFNKEQLDFASYIAAQGKDDITALFLENIVTLDEPLGKYKYLEGFDNPYKSELAPKIKVIEENIEAYKQACAELALSGYFLQATGLTATETIEASRFADLLLISPALSLERGHEETPTKFSEEVLSAAECPVLVMPNTTQEIKEVFFTYNGSFSSVYAIRQFTHLFPSFSSKKVTVLIVAEKGEGIVHKRYISEYMQHHYEEVEFKLLVGNPSVAILSHLYKQKEGIITFGAYGRCKFSQFFQKSKAASILKRLDMPVFITHP